MTGWRGPVLVMAIAAAVSGIAAVTAVPRAIMGVAIDRIASRAGLNQMAHGDLATPENQPIVRPSPDLAYSSCPYDLGAGPVVIDVNPVPGRYSSLSIFDGNTDAIFVRNDLQARGRPYRVTIALPDQPGVPGSIIVRTTEERGIALVRLLLQSPDELAGLQSAREQTRCRTLTAAPVN